LPDTSWQQIHSETTDLIRSCLFQKILLLIINSALPPGLLSSCPQPLHVWCLAIEAHQSRKLWAPIRVPNKLKQNMFSLFLA
jgi:hypothetical protein